MGAAWCWSCAKAKWVSSSPLPVATGEEELCWGFSATDFKTQVVWVKQGCHVESLKNKKKEGFCDIVCKVQSDVPRLVVQGVTCCPKNNPKAKSPRAAS